jgi:hypothetical protein
MARRCKNLAKQHVEEPSADVADIGSPIVKDGSVNTFNCRSPLLITNPSNGDRYRIVVYIQTTASVPYSFASPRSDASSDDINFDGYVLLDYLYPEWH